MLDTSETAPSPAPLAWTPRSRVDRTSGLVANGVKLEDSFIAGTEVLGQNPCYIWDIKTPGSEHLLDIRPVLASIEERLENGEVVAPQEGKSTVCQFVLDDVQTKVVVETGGVEEEVHGNPIEHQSTLTIDGKSRDVVICNNNLGG